MALFNKQDLMIIGSRRETFAQKSSTEILRKNSTDFSVEKRYDIFLSHSFQDAQMILGLKLEFEALGLSIYVDWIDDVQLDRSKVTAATADLLKSRMSSCECLFYVCTDNSIRSIWMPWELGYFDGVKGKVAIVPVIDMPNFTNTFVGQEYLGLYYYVTKGPNNFDQERLWIRSASDTYVVMSEWLKGKHPSKR